jgi:acylphosphatase
MDAGMERIRRHLHVTGHVQGVFFRDSVRRLAEQHGVSGWATNLDDGSVEVVLEGAREDVARLVAFSRDGPRGARVDRVDVAEEPPEGLDAFETR